MESWLRRIAAGMFLLGAGCGNRSADGPAVIRSDSAGVEIVESRAPAWSPDDAWVVVEPPLVEIGGTGSPDAELYNVSGVARLRDGTIVVADRGSHQLRFFATDGTFRSASGGEGEGPGEFRNLRFLRATPDDTLITFDLRLLRISVFDASGRFVRSFRLETTDAVAFAFVTDRFADGAFLAGGFAASGDQVPDGLQRFDAPLFHFGPDGAFRADMGMFPGGEVYYEAHDDGGFSFYPAMFGRSTPRRAAGNRVIVGDNDSYQFGLYDREGHLQRIVRRRHTPVPVTSGHVDRERERQLEDQSPGPGRDALRRALHAMPVPATFPAYREIRVDARARAWVNDYPIPGEPPRPWSVFDSSGVWLGQVQLPEGFDPQEIGEEYVTGVWRDEFDVEYVRVYRIDRGPGR